MRERYTAGESVPSIAHRMGLTPRQVYLWIRHERINRRPPDGPAWETFPIAVPELREWYEAGESIAGLARALDVSPRTVTMRLIESGATVRVEKPRSERLVLPLPPPVLRQRYEAGRSLNDLAAEMAVATATVKRRLLEAGTKMRPVGGPARSHHVELPIPAEELLRRFRAGESVHSLALDLGVPRNTLRGRLEIATKNHPAPVSDQPSPPSEARERPAPTRRETDGSDSAAEVPVASLNHVNRRVPYSARVWNYVLGGNDHYEADRQAAHTFQDIYPELSHLMATQRGFKHRAITYLAEQGVRQFLDIGPGLPAPDDHDGPTDTHIIAESATPGTRTLYVDNDPLVTARLRSLMVGHVHADIADTHSVLTGAARHLDLEQPVALLLIGVIGHIDSTKEAHATVRHLLASLAPGSYLALSNAINTKSALIQAQRTYNATGAAPYRLRTPARIAKFFADLSLVPPGLVPPALWRPASPPSGSVNSDARCAVARTRCPGTSPEETAR